MRFWRHRERGFSLVEVAIVLVVVGLIISGGLMGITPVLQGNRVTQTNEQMDKVDKALALYVIQNGCLPCPASPSGNGQALETGSLDYSTACGDGDNVSASCQLVQGAVPWVNLGLSKSEVMDAWGMLIDYATATTLTNTQTSMYRIGNTYPAGNIPVANAATSADTQTSAAAYVLVSHGADSSGGFNASNGAQKIDPNAGELQTCNIVTANARGAGGLLPACDAAGTYVQDTPRTSTWTEGYFDDIVRFKTAPVIVQSCGANACGNPAS